MNKDGFVVAEQVLGFLQAPSRFEQCITFVGDEYFGAFGY